MARHAALTLMLLMILLFPAGCGKKRAGLQDAAVLPDKTLFENGLQYINKNQYLRARLSFQTLINSYDSSEYLERAKFFLAYSYFREGGGENLIQAEHSFKDFRLFFPTSQLADDAQAYIVHINMRMMKSPNRDQTSTRKAETEIQTFLREYPDSPLVEELQLRLQYVHDYLAMSSFDKGNFYYKKTMYRASAARFKDCVQRYERFGRRDEALFLLADSLDRLQNPDESAMYYAQIVRGYPFSNFYSEARERLRRMERPIPDTDQTLADTNATYHIKSRSIWSNPLRGMFGILGFGGPEPEWRQMSRQRESQQRATIDSIVHTDPRRLP